MAQQLLLSIGRREDKSFDNYHAAENGVAVAHLRELTQADVSCRANRQLYLWGASTTGKSHLLQAACRSVDECGGRGAYLSLAQTINYDPTEVFEGLDSFDLLCLDDMDSIFADEDWQRGLFGMINLRRHLNGALVMAGRENPLHLNLPFGDLSSRLKWSTVYHLTMPEDNDKALILHSIVQRSGSDLSGEVIRYMLNNHSRDFSYLVEFVQSSVLAAQREKRQITIPFIRRLMENSSLT